MYHYSAVQWILFFYIYCLLGWCVESTYVSVKDRKVINRGFLKGPFLPLYGSGAILMLVVSMPFRDSLVLTYLSGCVGATILEYITGVLMEKLFKVRYWDYSRLKFNFQGRICLGTTLSWGALTIVMTQFLHRPVESFVLGLSRTQVMAFTTVISVIFLIDLVISVRAAVDLKNILVKMETARDELMLIQNRLVEMMGYAGNVTTGIAEGITSRTSNFTESVVTKKDEFAENISIRMDDLKQSVEEKFTQFTGFVKEKPEKYWENLKTEYGELKARYARSTEESIKPRRKIKDVLLKIMIRSNPGMTSEKFKESLEELKARLGYGGKDD